MKQTVMTVREVAKYLKMKPVTIYKHAQEGKLPAFKVGATWRFKRKTIDKWIETQESRKNDKAAMLALDKLRDNMKRLISDIANIPMATISDSANLQDDLGIDSFATTEILVAAEQKFNIIVNPDELFNIRTFGDVLTLAQRHIAQ